MALGSEKTLGWIKHLPITEGISSNFADTPVNLIKFHSIGVCPQEGTGEFQQLGHQIIRIRNQTDGARGGSTLTKQTGKRNFAR
jgi:hypothetical protein